jgi:hypothetical protein
MYACGDHNNRQAPSQPSQPSRGASIPAVHVMVVMVVMVVSSCLHCGKDIYRLQIRFTHLDILINEHTKQCSL